MKFKKINLAIITIAFVGILAWVIYKDGPENLLNMFRMLNPLWLGFSILFIIFYWILEGGILHSIVKPFYHKQKFKTSLRTSMIGQLFNCITPFASGGQPMQAYDMVKSGIPLGIASSSLIIKFIIYQFSLTIYSLAVLLFYWKPLSQKVNKFSYLVFIGFIINVLVMIILFCIYFLKNFTSKMANGLIQLLNKLHIVKNKEQSLQYIKGELEEFHKSFSYIKNNFSMVLTASLLSIIQLTIFFMIPYFISLAFGIHGISLFMAISAQAFVVMISSFVPLPGAAGGAEYSFHVFFEPFFIPYGISVNLAMLLWRLITFYFPILVGTFFTFGVSRKKNTETIKN